MKNKMFNPAFFSLALAILMLPGFTSCKKDKDTDPVVTPPSLKTQLVGDWEVKSFTIDGVEMKGFVINSSKFEFEAYSGTNGDFEWYIGFTDGSSENQTGDYTVDEDDKEVRLENEQGEVIKLDADIDDDELELSGTIDGERYVIKAERD